MKRSFILSSYKQNDEHHALLHLDYYLLLLGPWGLEEGRENKVNVRAQISLEGS